MGYSSSAYAAYELKTMGDGVYTLHVSGVLTGGELQTIEQELTTTTVRATMATRELHIMLPMSVEFEPLMRQLEPQIHTLRLLGMRVLLLINPNIIIGAERNLLQDVFNIIRFIEMTADNYPMATVDGVSFDDNYFSMMRNKDWERLQAVLSLVFKHYRGFIIKQKIANLTFTERHGPSGSRASEFFTILDDLMQQLDRDIKLFDVATNEANGINKTDAIRQFRISLNSLLRIRCIMNVVAAHMRAIEVTVADIMTPSAMRYLNIEGVGNNIPVVDEFIRVPMVYEILVPREVAPSAAAPAAVTMAEPTRQNATEQQEDDSWMRACCDSLCRSIGGWFSHR